MSHLVVGALTAAAAALVVAGAIKTANPLPTANALLQMGAPHRFSLVRALGAVEAVVGAGFIVIGGTALGFAVGGFYLAFAFFVLAAMQAKIDGSCGCFGVSDSPPSAMHAVTNFAVAAVAGLYLADPVRPLSFVTEATGTELAVGLIGLAVASAVIVAFAAR